MLELRQTTRFRFWLWLIRLIGVIVPRRLRADWREEWEVELRAKRCSLIGTCSIGLTNLTCCGAARAHFGMRCGCSHTAGRTQ